MLISLQFSVNLWIRSREGVKSHSMAIAEADESSAKALRQVFTTNEG